MKHMLCLILENGEITADLFSELSKDGYNATVLTSKSLKHLLTDPFEDDKIFINLHHLGDPQYSENSFAYFILEDEALKNVQDVIRESTDHFKKVKGCMFSYEIDNFEGSI